MIREAIEKITSLTEAKTFEIDGETYCNTELNLIRRRDQEKPERLGFNTLQGLVDLIRFDDGIKKDSFVHIIDYETVAIVGKLQPKCGNDRFVYAQAFNNQKSHQFGKYMDVETFIISLQSQFIDDGANKKLLAVVGNLANENIRRNMDNGITQTVQVKTGITTKSEVTIENPIVLKPFRTFREVVQPESSLIIRIKNEDGLMCALFEADGGKWKIDAVENIKTWLKTKLTDVAVIG